MDTAFNERKTTQAAAYLLKLWDGKRDYLSVIKLLYLIDREALLTWGRPVTFDQYVSMDKGPVLSRTYDLISSGPFPGEDVYWSEHISEPKHYTIELKKEAGNDELSEAEITLIEETFRKYGSLDKWKLVELSHELPEWENPQGSALPIRYKDIFQAGGKTEIEIASIEKELNSRIFTDSFFKKK
jgi:uncharacterized phage-associated protein